MKLIILNGPSGIGKSTISTKLSAIIPESVVIDIDELRRSIPEYKEKRQESLILSYQKAAEEIDSNLKNGRNVIVDKAISFEDTIDTFVRIGKKYKAEIYEFLLFADKETLQKRADERGYIPGSLLTREKVGELWEKANLLRVKRPSAVLIDTNNKDPEETLRDILALIGI